MKEHMLYSLGSYYNKNIEYGGEGNKGREGNAGLSDPYHQRAHVVNLQVVNHG